MEIMTKKVLTTKNLTMKAMIPPANGPIKKPPSITGKSEKSNLTNEGEKGS